MKPKAPPNETPTPAAPPAVSAADPAATSALIVSRRCGGHRDRARSRNARFENIGIDLTGPCEPVARAILLLASDSADRDADAGGAAAAAAAETAAMKAVIDPVSLAVTVTPPTEVRLESEM